MACRCAETEQYLILLDVGCSISERGSDVYFVFYDNTISLFRYYAILLY